MVKAFSKRFHFVHPKSKIINSNQISNLEGAEFEDVICNYVDAVAIARKIKNVGKRAVLIYKAIGYCDWEIALNLGVSERTIRRYINWLKEFLKNVS